MLRPRRSGVIFGAVVLAALLTPLAAAQTPASPVARAVLFFSPTCGHCEFVIQEVMPTWFEAHGGATPDVYFDESAETPAFFLVTNGTLEILLVDVTTADGFALFDATTEALAIGNGAVPRLIIGREVAIGSVDIPERVPAILERGLASDGIAWPALDGVTAAVARLSPAGLESSAATTTTTITPTSNVEEPAAINPLAVLVEDDSIGARFGRDPVGNSAAVVVLAGMLVVGGWLVIRRGRVHQLDLRLVPVLAAVGMAVATYLAAIESSGADAVCGPVGDCDAVQQSQYASIFGVPVGVIGVAGYAVMLLAWFLTERSDPVVADRSRLVLFAAAGGGLLFSIYLTFLEPFVIGATCAWCLTSAVIVTTVLVVATPYWVAGRPVAVLPESGFE